MWLEDGRLLYRLEHRWRTGTLSYEAVFWTGFAFQLAAVVWALRAVSEPHKRR